MQGVSVSDLPFERDELKIFLRSLSQATGLSMSCFPPGSDNQDIVIGESAFCLQLMSTSRPCRDKLHHKDAVVELRNHAGRQLDPTIVHAFINTAGEGKIG
jgi:hypothetical protein